MGGGFEGFNCPNLKQPKFEKDWSYPDFIISENDPREGKSIVVGDVKISGNSLYSQYVKPGTRRGQFNAITAYAANNAYSRTAVFLTVFTGQKSKVMQVRALLVGEGLRQGVAVVVVAAIKNKGFEDAGN